MPKLRSTIKDRILSRVIICGETGCWLWQGFTSGGRYGGYAMMKINGKNVLATRESYKQFVGDIPDGSQILHKCDTPKCVNPEHLWLGTQSDNMLDMHSKGRHKSGRCRMFFHKGKSRSMSQIAKMENVCEMALRYRLIKKEMSLSESISSIRGES